MLFWILNVEQTLSRSCDEIEISAFSFRFNWLLISGSLETIVVVGVCNVSPIKMNVCNAKLSFHLTQIFHLRKIVSWAFFMN